MTTRRRDGEGEAWAEWIRDNPRLDSVRDGLCCTDSDLWVHRYCTKVDRVGTRELQHIMLIEVKTFGRQVPPAQEDTYHLIDQILRRKDRKHYKRADGQKRWVRSWGVHYICLSGETPDDSDWITWDGKPVDVQSLEELLRFERHPDSLKPRSDRRHHTKSEYARLQRRLEV